MKIKINHLLLLAFFALFSLTTCQDEVVEVNNPAEQDTIAPSTQLVSLMSRTTANFGAMDDILDDSSCFSIELPVTIIVSDITIVIETEADLEQLEDLFEDFEEDEDFLDFVFPVTIIFSDYTQVVIENEDQFENFINECDDEDEEVIECVDFVYPISFSVFNLEFSFIDTVVIETDEALYNFLDDLEDDENVLIVSLNYPVTLEYADGEIIEVNSNEELANAIASAEEDCYDNNYCEEDNIIENLLACPWDFTDGTDVFNNYQFVFYQGGDLLVTEGDTTSAIGGSWSLLSTDDGLILNISDLTAFQDDLNGEWLIVECDDDELVIARGNAILELERDCEGDLGCSVGEINENIIECAWELETNLIDSFVPIYVYFTPDGQVLEYNSGGTENQIGIWELMQVGNNLFIEFTFQQGFDTLIGQWQIVECTEEELYLINGNNYINLEQECDLNTGNEVFNCFGDFEIVECVQPNNVPAFNLSANTIGLIDCQYPFTASFHTNIIDAENNTNAIENTETYETLESQVYLRIEAQNGNFEVFVVYLNTEDCNLFECFESFDAIVEQCDNGTDGPYAFNLTIAFSNCTPSADVVTYHESQADAETGVNAISNPESFATPNFEQLVYIRVEINNQIEVFPIQLLVVDCNPSVCSVDDINTFLTVCLWNAVNYNGSDNLMVYDFNFSSDGIVVIDGNETTIVAIWSAYQSNDGVIITFSDVVGANIQAITGEWLVVECEENRLELHRGEDILVLERTCD